MSLRADRPALPQEVYRWAPISSGQGERALPTNLQASPAEYQKGLVEQAC